MVKLEKIDNPTLDARELRMGDFIEFSFLGYRLSDGSESSYGVVVGTDDNVGSVKIRHFENGFPFEYHRVVNNGNIRKATKEASLAHFRSISGKFEKEFEAGGLAGVVSARKQHYLNGFITQIEAVKEGSMFYAATIDPQDPMTGRYVLMGIYSGQGPSEHLEGIAVVPRLSEATVSKIMREIRPTGFGRIPSDVYNTPATSHGSLVAYQTFEVPEKALHLLGNPKTLELKIN